MSKFDKSAIKKLVLEGFYRGLGWTVGATIGFALISTLLVAILKQLGGMPLVGSFLADLVDSTISQLTNNTPIIPN